ncbi:MAG: hypothetical protein GKR89_07495 [Candidatus Latescibacteria bacterium]|nr:hypothetical protein [Candidatus Latescibacterota bacterium]
MSEPGLPRLNRDQAAALTSLVGIGCKSRDTVLGLSAVRRVKQLAYLFVSVDTAPGTVGQLAQLERQGTRLYLVDGMEALTRSCGRPDVLIVGIKPGGLAEGIGGRLQRAGAP